MWLVPNLPHFSLDPTFNHAENDNYNSFYRNLTQLDNTVAAVEKVDFLESEFKADRKDIFLKVHKNENFFSSDF
jgi:hypothetical protein